MNGEHTLDQMNGYELISNKENKKIKESWKFHLTWVGISSAVHIQSMEKEADTQKLREKEF